MECPAFGAPPDIHFENGTPARRVEEMNHLGCTLNSNADVARELGNRIDKCKPPLQKMHIFWKRGNCDLQFKVNENT